MILKAFAGEDLRGVYAYLHVPSSNLGGFSDTLHGFISTAGAQGLAVRFFLIGFDAMCAAELLAVQLDAWQKTTAIELMVYQHKFIGDAIKSHPATIRAMTFSEEP
jgi:hypothetical protein